MPHWQNEDELFNLIREKLYPAVVGDIMDTMGLQHQFLPPRIQPLRQDMLIAGRAMPVLEADIDSDALRRENPQLEKIPFGLMFRALDDLAKNEVYICSGSSASYALWGELMSTRAMKLGAAGAVVDGYSRDTPGIMALNFPTFSHGRYAQDQGPRGKVIDFRIPITLGGILISPGDLVIGDLDGVCIVPKEAVEAVIMKSLEKAAGEKLVQQKIQEGMSTVKAFELYGIM